MLVSPIENSISFKDTSGSFPNRSNTLYNDRKKGGLTLRKYFQKFNNSDIIYIQFVSDSATVPTLKSYTYGTSVENTTISGSLANSRLGDTNRYYFNYTITLNASYQNKTLYFIATQGADSLTSEPICVADYSDEIARGDLKKLQYANNDINSFSGSTFADWTVLDYMYFYVESIDQYSPEGSVDLLDNIDQKVNVASRLFAAEKFSTGGIPDYMCEKIIAAAILDVFTINDTYYVLNEISDPEPFDKSTLYQMTLSLTVTTIVGLNSDDYGVVESIAYSLKSAQIQNVIIAKSNTNVTGSGWQVENPEGYMLHSILIKHNSASSASTAIVTCGTTVSGTDIINSMDGEIIKAEYSSKYLAYPRHFLKDESAAYDLYFEVTGAGADLTIIVNFDTITPAS